MQVELNIKCLLDDRDMRLTDLENIVDLSYQQLWNIKEGRTTRVNFETIGKLLEAFHCTPNELFKITKQGKGNNNLEITT